MALPNYPITPIPNNEPDAVPSLWNERYVEIDANFDALDTRQTATQAEIDAARQGKASLDEAISQIVAQIGGLEEDAASMVTPMQVGRAYTLEQDYNDEGFNFELFSDSSILSFRDFTAVDVTEVTSGDDTLDVVNTSLLQEGESYILCNAAGAMVQAFEVDVILTATRLRAKANFTASFASGDGASIKRSTWSVDTAEGRATVRHQDRLYSRVLSALEYWDQGRLVIRRSADGSGAFVVKYRAANTETWATAEWLGNTTRAAGTRDEEFAIGIGGKIELQIDYTGADAADTDTVEHMVLYTPPRADTLSLIAQPVNTAPASEAVNVGQTPTLNGGTFRHVYGLSQGGAQFQVAEDKSFSSLILNTSSDYLASWMAITQAEVAGDLSCIAMTGDGLGIAGGASGAAMVTADGGDTWSEETLVGSDNVLCCAQTSTMRLVGGANGLLESSVYSGTWGAWSALTPAGSFANSIAGIAVQGSNIVFVGDGGEIQTSNDGGTFFAARTAAGSYAGNFGDVVMDGSGNCIAVGATGEIQTSNDFGVTWTQRSAAGSYTGAFAKVSMDESGNAIAVGASGEIQTTSDYGATWTARTADDSYSGDFSGVALTADGDAVAVGTAGEIQTSEDGGVTWFSRAAAGAFANAFGGVAIDGNDDAVTVGDSGEVQKANKLDAAWTTFAVPTGDDMLQTGAIYWWRCRYQDTDGHWSPWSTPTAFATSAVFDYVVQPSAVAPASGAESVSLEPTLSATAFAYVGSSVTHAKSQWQISTSSDFGTLHYNSGESDDLESHAVPGGSALAVDTAYYWRVRYKDSDDKWSAWSTPVAFTSAKRPNQPSITAPSAGATGVLETPTLSSTLFSTPVPDTHIASQWRISATSGDYASPVWDSGTVGSLTSITIPSGVLSDGETVYYVQVRHKGNELGWSSWSNESQFITAVAFNIQVSSNTEYVYRTSSISDNAIARLESTKAAVFYCYAGGYPVSDYLACRVITSSGAMLSFDAPVTLDTGDIRHVKTCALSAIKTLLIYQKNDFYARTVDFSGATPTAGSTVLLTTGYDYAVSALSETTALLHYKVGNYSARVRVLTISGDTISLGTEVEYTTDYTRNHNVARLSATKAIISHEVDHSPAYVRIVDVSSGTPVVSAAVQFTNGNANDYTMLVGLSDSVALLCTKYNALTSAHARVVNISGSTITLGSEQEIEASDYAPRSLLALNETDVLLLYTQAGVGKARGLRIDGNTIETNHGVSTYNASDATYVVADKISVGNVIVAYSDVGVSNYATAQLIEAE